MEEGGKQSFDPLGCMFSLIGEMIILAMIVVPLFLDFWVMAVIGCLIYLLLWGFFIVEALKVSNIKAIILLIFVPVLGIPIAAGVMCGKASKTANFEKTTNPEDQYNLGPIRSEGNGVPKDREEAAKQDHKITKQGDSKLDS